MFENTVPEVYCQRTFKVLLILLVTSGIGSDAPKVFVFSKLGIEQNKWIVVHFYTNVTEEG